jgi:hypothetical protein
MSCVNRKTEDMPFFAMCYHIFHKAIQQPALLGLSLTLLLEGIWQVHLTLNEGEQIVAPLIDLF